MKKIGIVTFNDAYNYGAFLQEYALQLFLKTNGVDAKVIKYSNQDFKNKYVNYCNVLKANGIKNKIKALYNAIFKYANTKARKLQIKNFELCIENEICYSIEFKKDNIKAINDSFDYFIAGSDQVWNLNIIKNNYFYMLDFVYNDNKKISYAASFGTTNFLEEQLVIFKEKLSRFNTLLVREEEGKSLLYKIGLDSDVVLDPTFLIDKKKWKEFCLKANQNFICQKKYIFIYIVAKQTYLLDAAFKYANELGLEVICISHMNRNIVWNGKKIKCIVGAGPYEFINYLINAECIFTTSFHGLVLSINVNKPFYYELSKEKNNNNSRLENISRFLELSCREIKSSVVLKNNINWDNVNEKLMKLKIKSKELLMTSIGCEKNEKN